MDQFDTVYDQLNPEQREAVDAIDGPLLVVAGPGTGKTQLLSARVANILKQTDTLPQNILCLTFTESGAANMRERLSRFIGQRAYDVNIGTYHAFGGDIIRRYGEYFTDEPLSQPIDQLRKHQIVSSIIDSLSYSDRLKQTRYHIKDVIATISEIKRALLTADDLRAIANENAIFIDKFDDALGKIFTTSELPRSYAKARPYYDQIYDALTSLVPSSSYHSQFGSLARVALLELDQAFATVDSLDKPSTTPLTKWKTTWLTKNSNDRFVCHARLQNERLASLANVLETYEAKLRAEELYDFDDMILKAIHVIRTNDDLRYTLQEQYQYLLLDEYQDTNAAQAELVWLLTDSPVNEGRPNVMAVGDDDQAIYAFQGAQYSNMLDFFRRYRDTRLVNLSKNYRSHRDVLTTAANIADQIDERLFHQFPGTSKTIEAANTRISSSHLERRDFRSQIAEDDWIASSIATLVKQGTDPRDIAILAPKHKYLEPIIPYLNALQVPVRYEKRENILEAPHTIELITIARLVLAISHDESIADSLWPNVLTYEWLHVPITTIWNLSWQVRDHNRTSASRTSWTRELLNHEDVALRQIAQLFVAIAQRVDSDPCERVLDYLIGTTAITVNEVDGASLVSPMREHYLAKGDAQMIDMVSDLTVLRTKLRDYQHTSDAFLKLADLVALVDAYHHAEELMLNTSPYAEADSAVQLMTVFKAKGLEFSHVFLVDVDDDAWGGSGSSNTNKLTLPANLAPTRHSGATEDERLRLLFVAVTRAKHHLYMTRYLSTYAGKATKRLKYLDEREQSDESHHAFVLPEHARTVESDDHDAPSREALEYNWLSTHINLTDPSLRDMLQPRLEHYQLSPTHLNKFCDLIYGGPTTFFVETLLGFPSAPGISGEFGNAIHESLEWLQHQVTARDALPTERALLDYFDTQLAAKKLPDEESQLLTERGHRALRIFLAQRGDIYAPTDKAETNFRHEGVFVGAAHMAGKIDRLEIDTKSKTITVVDYKTGSAYTSWKSDPKLHKYKQQLYCYKLLVERSHSFEGYTVDAGRLEFVEPDDEGVCRSLSLSFTDDEVARTAELIESMWRHVQAFELPDVTGFAASMKGIREFETYLLDNTPDKV